VTLEMVAQAINSVVQSVHAVEPIAKPLVPPEDAPPTPRPVKLPVGTKNDEWDFLKPVARLPKAPSYLKEEETVTLKPAGQ
jgi:hypothetical protein